MTWPTIAHEALKLLLVALDAFGLAYILGHSRISLPFRLWLARPSGPSHGGRRYCPWCPPAYGPHQCVTKCSPVLHVCTRLPDDERKPIPWEYQRGPNHLFTVAPPGAVYDRDEYVPPSRSAIRDWLVELIECPMCFGTWTGLAFGLLMPTLLPIELPRVAAGIALAFFTAATNYLLGRASGLVPAA